MYIKASSSRPRKDSKVPSIKFPEALDDTRIPEALEFSLAVLNDIIKNRKKKEEKEIVHLPSSTIVFPQKTHDPIPSQDCISKLELDDLINRYLEVLDDYISESREGRKAKDENKVCEPLTYQQELVRPNQNETHTFGPCSRNGNEDGGTNTDNEFPESDDFAIDLIDDYLAEEPVAKRKKEVTQEPSNIEKDEDKTFTKESEVRRVEDKRIKVQIDEFKVLNRFQISAETSDALGCYYVDQIAVAQNNEKEIRVKEAAYKDPVKADKTKNELPKIESKESQALPYYQKSAEATKTSHVVKPSRGHMVKIERGAPMDFQETFRMDDVNEIDSNEFIKEKEIKIENVPVHVEKATDDKPKLILDKDLDRRSHFERNELFTKDLNEACGHG
ncbi:hypothetical protein C2G38_2238648 [Gigaspora rosea]|uniref:Uncharacterized protein n=1 Tax=Gigaspora rosea TaxID=44941 RepID=A0A397W8X1_9GLOM|nr:hypothetical protein C2G38_2238648 [Gigaspora rosea]